MGQICAISGGKIEPSLTEMIISSRVRQGLGQGSPDMSIGGWKHEKSEYIAKMSENKSEWSCMQTMSVVFRKWENKHVCEASRRNDYCQCRNKVMHATSVRCNEKIEPVLLQAKMH